MIEKICSYYFFDTQTSWIKYNGLLDRINFIGKYENLNKDFKLANQMYGKFLTILVAV